MARKLTKTYEPTAFGAALHARRKEQGMTLRQVGQASGLTYGYLSQIERGYAPPPSYYSITTLAKVLDSDVTEFLKYADRKLAPNAACMADIYEHFKTNDSLSDNQFIELAEKHGLLAEDLTLQP